MASDAQLPSNGSDDSTERYYSEMESARNVSMDAYFGARPQLLKTHAEQALYRAGFERAFQHLWNKAHGSETLPVAAPSGGHTVFCDHCDASALLPYTDATKSSVAIGPMQGWNIETRMGVMCPKCASEKAYVPQGNEFGNFLRRLDDDEAARADIKAEGDPENGSE